MSDMELQDAVRELGGTEEDLEIVADADFSGSDWEDSGSAKNSNELEAEVARFLDELNEDKSEFLNGEDGSSVNKKMSSEKSHSKKPINVPMGGSKNSVQFSETKRDSLDPKKPESSSGHVIAESRVRFDGGRAISKASKLKQIQMSKKAKFAWESYINSLQHPQSLVIDNKSWVNLSETQSEREEVHSEIVQQLKQKAETLLQEEISIYYRHRKQDREFVTSLEFLKNGTFGDQLGTLSILSTESPLHSMRFLENLRSKCEVKNRESACKALEVTKDLLVSHILPDRRLKWFKDQPIKLGIQIETLIAWAFEDFLKNYYFKLLQIMEKLLADTVENIRTRTLYCVFDLFKQKPEQEANLLRLGLNKLGDPAGKVASRVKQLLMSVLQLHPGMKVIVAKTMEEILSRSSDYRLRYYAIDSLSEFILSSKQAQLANKLIFIYLNLFERLLTEAKDAKDVRKEVPVTKGKPKTGNRFRPKRGKKGGIQQKQFDATETENQKYARLVAKLFTGLNRAFPFSNLDSKVYDKYIDTIYKLSHSFNAATFIEALTFIFQLSKTAGASSLDRFYRSLYESLLDMRLPHSNKLAKYIHLLLKSMAELDTKDEYPRGNSFVKRLLQVSCHLSEIGAAASLIHVANLTPASYRLVSSQYSSTDDSDSHDKYDCKQRDPRFTRAETSRAWELVLLQQHYHPTVSLYAKNMLSEPTGRQKLDMPNIEQYTVNHFLNKWSYKKPKSKESTHGGSIFQPLAGFTDLTLGIRQEKRPKDDVPAPVKDWKSENIENIAPEERFLYDYFVQRPDRKLKTKFSTENDIFEENKEVGSDSDDIAEDEINEAMSKAGPLDDENIEMEMYDLSDDDEDGDLDSKLANAFSSESDSEDNGYKIDGIGENNVTCVDDISDGFADFSESDKEGSSNVDLDGKKRKRWSHYPVFMDADAFEDTYSEKQLHKKRH